jgi:hypothetical protein
MMMRPLRLPSGRAVSMSDKDFAVQVDPDACLGQVIEESKTTRRLDRPIHHGRSRITSYTVSLSIVSQTHVIIDAVVWDSKHGHD